MSRPVWDYLLFLFILHRDLSSERILDRTSTNQVVK